MSGPLILIVGSADVSRSDYDPPLSNPGTAPVAAEELGAELARRGCRIVVYSSSESYLERSVVRGFVGASKKTANGTIQVRYPYSEPGSAQFPEAQSRPDLFVPTADRNAGWEAAFYASLRDADGMLVIGGGRSAHAIGHMALAFQIPLITLACFGGAAKAVWLAIRPGTDLASEENLQVMNPPAWRSDLSPGIVAALLAQGEIRRSRAQAKEADLRGRTATLQTTYAVLMLMAAIGATVWGFTLSEPHTVLFAWLLFFVGPVAGAGSALASAGWKASDRSRSTLMTAGLGFVAGAISSLFYLLAQVSTVADAQSIKGLAIVVAMTTGLLAGFTFDQAFQQATAGKLKAPGDGKL